MVLHFGYKKATGHDAISACLLRSISPVIINTLCEIVNICISSGKFPAIWKKALVKPLHKSGPTDLVNNYRQISILCVASNYLNSMYINTLCEIVNMSISSGKFPAIWKKALVKPLHKSGPTDLVNNYRPISILCVSSKLLEFHVHKCLYRYICDKDILYSN